MSSLTWYDQVRGIGARCSASDNINGGAAIWTLCKSARRLVLTSHEIGGDAVSARMSWLVLSSMVGLDLRILLRQVW